MDPEEPQKEPSMVWPLMAAILVIFLLTVCGLIVTAL